MDEPKQNQREKVTNLIAFPDNFVVRTPISPRGEYSRQWRDACRVLLEKYLEICNLRSVKRYAQADLHREIMRPHHKYDMFGRLIEENNLLTRQDLGHFLKGRSQLKSAKFCFIDFFINQAEVWSHPLFLEARKQAVDVFCADEAETLTKVLRPRNINFVDDFQQFKDAIPEGLFRIKSIDFDDIFVHDTVFLRDKGIAPTAYCPYLINFEKFGMGHCKCNVLFFRFSLEEAEQFIELEQSKSISELREFRHVLERGVVHGGYFILSGLQPVPQVTCPLVVPRL
jgi:hypothetical protein